MILTGPALTFAGGSRCKSCNSFVIRLSAILNLSKIFIYFNQIKDNKKKTTPRIRISLVNYQMNDDIYIGNKN